MQRRRSPHHRGRRGPRAVAPAVRHDRLELLEEDFPVPRLVKEPEVNRALGNALDELLQSDDLSTADAKGLAAADERRACHYFSSVEQVVADLHRSNLVPHLLDPGTLRDVLKPKD